MYACASGIQEPNCKPQEPNKLKTANRKAIVAVRGPFGFCRFSISFADCLELGSCRLLFADAVL
jgi:hypothetical protein